MSQFVLIAILQLLAFSMCDGYNISINFLGYTVNDPDASDIEVTTQEISGAIWFRKSINSPDNKGNIFYAISDDLVENKGWIKYAYNSSNYGMTAIGGTILGENPWGDNTLTDSESIAIIGLPFVNGFYDDLTENTPTNELVNGLYAYFVIGKEGHRTYHSWDHIMLYDMDGTYIKEFYYPSLFNITDNSGTQNNGGFEALEITSDYTTIAYANERRLLQDDCTACVCCFYFIF